MPKVAFYTLGCKSNQYETDRMTKIVSDAGFEIVPYPGPADTYVINTCTVTGNADKKSRHAVRYAKKMSPSAKVIVTGCYVETDRFNMKEADTILSNKDKFNLVQYLPSRPLNISPSFTPSSSSSPRIRANLMIENGCENFCSYCIVPHVRGKITSMPFDQVMAEAKQMVKDGVKEIILTGINLGEYALEPETKRLGSDRSNRNRDVQSQVPMLINELSKIDGLLRIRLSSIEPMYIDDELIETVKKNPKVCKHLHIPMQSGDDRILKAMNRNYTAKDFLSMAKKVKKQIKDVAITTDIIIGFPGEDEKAFKNTLKLIDKIQFSRIHIFSYSDRPGTQASNFKNKIDPKTIAKRHEKMNALREKYMLKFHRSFSKNPIEVLIEQRDGRTGMYEGLTSNYIRVFLEGDDMGDEMTGRIIPAQFKDFQGENVIASPVLV
jgi:threonylcarbamoyladenosine tRNA methylthiotransferase MtaB